MLRLMLLFDLVDGHVRAQHRQPDGLNVHALALRALADMLHQLVHLLDALHAVVLLGEPGLHGGHAQLVDQLDGVIRQLGVALHGDGGRAAPAALAQQEHLVVAHLQIVAARAGQGCRLGALEHAAAVRLVLHLQADAEAGVALDLSVNDARGLLRGQDQVHAQASADAGRADQLVHEVRLLLLEFGKLVRHDDDMLHRLGHRALAEELLIAVDVQVALLEAVAHLLEDALAAFELRGKGVHGAVDAHAAAQVVDDAHHMGQGLQGIGHAAALVVDQHEADLQGAVCHRHGKQVGDDKF